MERELLGVMFVEGHGNRGKKKLQQKSKKKQKQKVID